MRETITYFIPTLKLAGTSTQALAFCDAMHAAGYDIELVVDSKRGEFLESAASKTYAVRYLHDTKFLTPLFTVYFLVRYLLKQRPTVLLSGAKGVNILAIFAHFLSGKRSRLILVLTNELLQRQGATARGRYISKRLHLWLYKFADQTIVLTAAMQNVLLEAGFSPSKVKVIAPPINAAHIRQASLEPLDHPWLLTEKSKRDVPVILAVGRLTTQKNYPELIKAFAIAKKTRPLRLIILGSGSVKFTAALKKLADQERVSDSIDFVGFSANPYQYMAHANVFALCSHWEGFGIVIAEALACGLTIASTDCPDGPREILANGTFGYLAKPYNPEDLAQIILKAAQFPLDAKALTIRAAEYNSNIIISKYRTLIDGQPSGLSKRIVPC